MNNDIRDAYLDRQSVEISLLQAMYPEQLEWSQTRNELKYTGNLGAFLTLRLPENYPKDASPMLISALDSSKNDLRDLTRNEIASLQLPLDEEVLDTIIQAFENLVNNIDRSDPVKEIASDQLVETIIRSETSKTVIIWLHHLLNTNKRKLAITPGARSTDFAGITKPGYPGVILYSGDAQSVTDHVAELKQQKWQAFQVRFEETSSEPWKFAHGSGVREVETMSEISQGIVDQNNRETFLRAVHIK